MILQNILHLLKVFLILTDRNFLRQSLQMMTASCYLMFLNQLIASEVFFHWFTFVLLSSDLLILSKICILILLISDFDGLISLNDGELGNPSL